MLSNKQAFVNSIEHGGYHVYLEAKVDQVENVKIWTQPFFILYLNSTWKLKRLLA